LKENRQEALRWLKQAENDLEYAKLGLKEGFFAQVCFQCQQVCEKTLKSIHYGYLKKRIVYGHSLVNLSKNLNLEESLIFFVFHIIYDYFTINTFLISSIPGPTTRIK